RHLRALSSAGRSSARCSRAGPLTLNGLGSISTQPAMEPLIEANANASGRVDLSLVIPCYNETEVLPLLKTRLVESLPKLGVTWEVILVDDGSTDDTREQLAALHRVDARFKIISLSRNFGHQAAICAGLAFVSGNAVGIMDADLQDPPEIFSEALRKLREGY